MAGRHAVEPDQWSTVVSASSFGECMQLGSNWQKALWRILRNPALEVVAAIVVMLIAAWVVVQSETEQRSTVFPVPFSHR